MCAGVCAGEDVREFAYAKDIAVLVRACVRACVHARDERLLPATKTRVRQSVVAFDVRVCEKGWGGRFGCESR